MVLLNCSIIINSGMNVYRSIVPSVQTHRKISVIYWRYLLISLLVLWEICDITGKGNNRNTFKCFVTSLAERSGDAIHTASSINICCISVSDITIYWEAWSPPLASPRGTWAILVKWSPKVLAQCGIVLTPSFFKQHQPTQSAITQDTAASADQCGQYSIVKRGTIFM